MHDVNTRIPAAERGRGRVSIFLAASLPLLLLLTVVVYWPGLSGPFLLDDFANLDALGKFGGVRDLETLKLYLLGGRSGPTGRPLALLSFLLDSNNWPADPRSFKRTNLLLHLLNGVILFALTRKLLKLVNWLPTNRGNLAALLTAGAWLLHPLLVSTVMYPVQRMVILSTLFILLGLWGFVHGWEMLEKNRRRAYLWMSISLAGGTLLAVLCKENGVLLPLLALVLTVTLLAAADDTNKPDWRWSSVFLWIPAVVPVAYVMLMVFDGSLATSFIRRSFDVTGRLLTESRILFDYLGWWFYPRVHSPGLLIHGYPISHGLLDPPITLLAITGVVSFVTAAIYLRRRYPLFSLAVLFFFAGHWLESGPLSLELYFEHRNYLPAVFLFLPIMVKFSRINTRHKAIILVGPALLLALALLSYQRATIWGNEERLAYSWAEMHPTSQRAQRYAAIVAEKAGKPERAIEIIQDARQRQPKNVMFGLHALTLKCRYQQVTQPELESFISLIRTPYKIRPYEAWHQFVKFAPTPECRGLEHDDVLAILTTLKENPLNRKHRGRQQSILHLIGLLAADDGRRADAYQSFSKAQQVKPDIERALLQSSILATRGYFPEALSLLESAELVYRRNDNADWLTSRGKLNYGMEIDILKQTIAKDMVQAGH